MAPWREWCLVSPFETVCRLNRRQLISASAELIINLLSAQIRSGFSCCISQNRGLTVPFSSVVFKFPSAIEAIIAFVSCTCQALFLWVIFFYFRKEKSVTVVFTGATRLTKPFQRLPPAFRYVHTLSTKVGISPLFCQNGWCVPCLERVKGSAYWFLGFSTTTVNPGLDCACRQVGFIQGLYSSWAGWSWS